MSTTHMNQAWNRINIEVVSSYDLTKEYGHIFGK